MSLQKNNKALDRCLRYAVIRQCSTDIEKAVILVLNFKSKYNLSIRSICQKFKIHHLTLRRAVWERLVENGLQIQMKKGSCVILLLKNGKIGKE